MLICDSGNLYVPDWLVVFVCYPACHVCFVVVDAEIGDACLVCRTNKLARNENRVHGWRHYG